MNARTSLTCVGLVLFLESVVTTQERPKAVPLVVDCARSPGSVEEALKTTDVVAVVRVTGRRYKDDSPVGLPQTEVNAEVIEVLSNPRNLPVGSTVDILRDGGLLNIKGVAHVQEQLGFPPWSNGRTLLVFLGWSDEHQVFCPRFGPEYVFEEDQAGKVRTPGRRPVTRSYKGRPFPDVVASIRAAVR